MASRYVKYGVIDVQLFKLLQNKQFANHVTDILFSKYFHINTSIQKDKKLNSTKNQIDDSYLADFKVYLSKCTNNHGKPFAPSSINAYIGGLKNEYMQAKVRPYAADGLIENIESIRELENLYSTVKNDAIKGLISSSVHAGLRLYIEYRKSKIKGPSTIPTIKTPNTVQATLEGYGDSQSMGYEDFLRSRLSTSGKEYTESTITSTNLRKD